ncbi:MAG TPA: acylneuraminate cytidylyltransferase family protein [Stellaceae bacterium]|jgi:N-acylneuraminate cytidylyltransferase
MIGGRSVLGLIPARGGSRGVPRKNVRLLGGRPLIAWTIEAARQASTIDRLVLSSDNAEIIAVATGLGAEAPFVRPAELATDDADALSVVRHALAALPDAYDYLVLLQPTSPFRTGEDIDNTVALCARAGAPCVSVCQPDKSPYWMFEAGVDGRLVPLFATVPKRRQDAPAVVLLNGAVYAAETQQLRAGRDFLGPDTVYHMMPKARSLDIDAELDFAIAELLIDESAHGTIST